MAMAKCVSTMFTWYVVTLKDPIYPVIRVRRPHRPSKRGDATLRYNRVLQRSNAKFYILPFTYFFWHCMPQAR